MKSQQLRTVPSHPPQHQEPNLAPLFTPHVQSTPLPTCHPALPAPLPPPIQSHAHPGLATVQCLLITQLPPASISRKAPGGVWDCTPAAFNQSLPFPHATGSPGPLTQGPPLWATISLVLHSPPARTLKVGPGDPPSAMHSVLTGLPHQPSRTPTHQHSSPSSPSAPPPPTASALGANR